MNDYNIKKIIKLQSYIRRYIVILKLKKDENIIQIEHLKLFLNNFINYTSSIDRINTYIKDNNKKIYKKIRNPNFPSEISENLVKYVFYKKYNIYPKWNIKSGDLVIDLIHFIKKIEIKAFISTGPSSFGPSESWDYIYFVDAREYKNKRFKIYEIKLSNDDTRWKNIFVNKTTTYYDQCIQGRRPRIKFFDLKKQLDKIDTNICNLIFDDSLDNLF